MLSVSGRGSVICLKWYTRAMARMYPEKLFVFGDNLRGTGLGGQAKEMRGEPNAVGIPTKRSPSRRATAFFSDADFQDAKRVLDRRFEVLETHLATGGDVVWPEDGVGTGLAQLPDKAPKIYAYIQTRFGQLCRLGGGRGRQAYEYRRLRGLSWREIAEQLGYASHQVAHAMARRYAGEFAQPWPPPTGVTTLHLKGKQAYEMRSYGLTWPQIANRLGYSFSEAAHQGARRYALSFSKEWPVSIVRDNPRGTERSFVGSRSVWTEHSDGPSGEVEYEAVAPGKEGYFAIYLDGDRWALHGRVRGMALPGKTYASPANAARAAEKLCRRR